MKTEQILCLIMAELERAEKLHPAWPTDLVKASAILAEEAGETLRAANTFDETRSGKKEIVTEAVQDCRNGNPASQKHQFERN